MLRAGLLHGLSRAEQDVSNFIDASARTAWAEVEKHLRPFVVRRLDDPADTGDVLHEIYLRVQAGLPGLRDTERFGAWVYQVARSALADHGRTRARHHPPGVKRAGPEGDVAAIISVPVDEPSAERELASYLATFVAALAAPYRQALILTELQEMDHKDAAQMLGISLPALKARVRRGRQQIQRMLEACCDVALDVRGHVVSYERRADGIVPETCCAGDEKCGG